MKKSVAWKLLCREREVDGERRQRGREREIERENSKY